MKYRKKPIEVEAVQYTGDNLEEVKAFALDKIYSFVYHETKFDADGCGAKSVPMEIWAIHTLEGDMAVCVGDYIIKGVNGEYYPCKPDIFEKTYEAVLRLEKEDK